MLYIEFASGGPLLLTDVRETEQTLEGEVVNGLWPFYYNKEPGSVFAATNKDQCILENLISTGNRITRRLDIPKDVPAHGYNAIMLWAKARLDAREAANGL